LNTVRVGIDHRERALGESIDTAIDRIHMVVKKQRPQTGQELGQP